ncbi:hypothetical protein C0J52_13517, partial [Blattella germanica]
KTVAQVQRLFRQVSCTVPNRNTILSIGEKFQETGSVKERARSGRRVSAKKINLKSWSGIKHVSYFCMAYLKKNSKFWAYRIQILQALHLNDYRKQQVFCEVLGKWK